MAVRSVTVPQPSISVPGSRPSGDERPDFVLLQLTCQCWREDWAQRYFGDGTGLEIKPHALDA